MKSFVSNYTMKLDSKGRVSIPAPFRAILAGDGLEDLYCIPTPELVAIDAGGSRLQSTIEQKLAEFDETSIEHDYLSTAFYGQSENLKMDREGRVVLTESLKDLAGITDRVTFVGKGHRFQMWEPDRFQVFLDEARRRALAVLRRPSPEKNGAGEGGASRDAGE